VVGSKEAMEFDKEFFIPITHQDGFRVRVKTRGGDRHTYVIQVECQFAEEEGWLAVIRADDFHDLPHLDILYPSGEKQKVWLRDLGDDKMNMKEARIILIERWQQERSRYEQQLNK